MEEYGREQEKEKGLLTRSGKMKRKEILSLYTGATLET